MEQSRFRQRCLELLPVLGVFLVVLYFANHFQEMRNGIDFCHFYAAARIVHDGRAAQLYDPLLQHDYLARYTGRVGTYFAHPAFETLIYLPFCLWSLSSAYILWCAFNAVLILLVSKLLSDQLLLSWSWSLLGFLSLLYVPVLLNFLQGQDSLLLLFVLCAAFTAAQRHRNFLAGCLLACGCFKFHLMIPIVIVLVFGAGRDLWRGLLCGGLGILGLSVATLGWSATATYPRFLYRVSSLPLAGFHYRAMANLRGLWEIAMPDSPRLTSWLVVASSLSVLGIGVYASRLCKRSGSNKLAWTIAVLTAILVSYPLSPHDLTILLLPAALLVDHVRTHKEVPQITRVFVVVMSGLLLLPPLHLLLLAHHMYAPAGVITMLLYVTTYAEIQAAPLLTLAK
jgi:hypothetical protein